MGCRVLVLLGASGGRSPEPALAPPTEPAQPWISRRFDTLPLPANVDAMLSGSRWIFERNWPGRIVSHRRHNTEYQFSGSILLW